MDQRIGNRMGVAAVDVGGGTNATNLNGGGTGGARLEHDDADYATVTALRARLTAIDSTFYSATTLNTMTYNDMVYAVRVNDSASTVR